MKAIVRRHQGSPEVLHYEEIARPKPGEREVLIRVHAAGLNPLDYHLMRASPLMTRIFTGHAPPAKAGIGLDVAGEVESVGSRVTQFHPGDAVYGSCRGACAEYVCADESAVVPKPEGITFEQAAAVPIAAYTALQGLRDKVRLQPGQHVLIHGAGGGVGTFAVQIAKTLGAQVTAVTGTANLALVRSLGADHVIDYNEKDFTSTGERYDVIFDCHGSHPLGDCLRALTAKGIYLAVGGPVHGMAALAAGLMKMIVQSWFLKKRMTFLIAKPNRDDLLLMNALMRSGKVTAVLDRMWSLPGVPDAIRYLEKGHARGKVVIAV